MCRWSSTETSRIRVRCASRLMNRYENSRRETCGLAFYDTCTLQMDFMRGKTIRVPEKLRRETARGGSPLVRVTGLEPAHLMASEPNDTVTLLELMFSNLTNAIIARISAVVKCFVKSF